MAGTTTSKSAGGRRKKSDEPRELAQRVSGDGEVSLLWRKSDNALTVRVVDTCTGIAFRIRVHPEEALDAYNHPYIYAGLRGIDSWEDAPLAANAVS
jgi:hypothetical protein